MDTLTSAELVTRIYERIGNPNRTFQDIHVRDWCDAVDCIEATQVIRQLIKDKLVASCGWQLDDDRGYLYQYRLTAQGVAVALRQLTPAP